MNSEVRPLTKDEYALWDEFVDNSSRGTLFHKSFWLKSCGRKFVIYGYFKGPELYAGIPITNVRKFGVKIASQPILTPYGGVLFKEQDAKYVSQISAEKEASQKIARQLKSDAHLVHFSFSPGSVDLQSFIWEGFSPSVMYTYIIQTNKSLEDLWKAMEGTRRTRIRKAEKDGLTIIQSDDFNQTMNLVEKTFMRQHEKVLSEAMYFRYNKVLEERKQCKSFLAVDRNGECVASVYIAWDKWRSYYLLGGYDSERGHSGASALAIWYAIKFTKEELGLDEFDLEGSMVPQIEQFFRRFGGQLTVRHIVTWTHPFLKLPVIVWRSIHPILSTP